MEVYGSASSSALVLALAIFPACYILIKWLSSDFSRPPGPMALPVIGHMHLIGSKSLHILLSELSKVYGKIFTMQFGARKAVILSDRDTIQEAFVKNSKAFSGRPDLPTFRETRNGETGLSLCDYSETYMANRKNATKAVQQLTRDTEHLSKALEEESAKMLRLFDDYAGNQTCFSPLKMCQRIIPSIFVKILFGMSFEYTDEWLLKMIETYRVWFDQAEADNPADFFPLLDRFPNKRLNIIRKCGVAFEEMSLHLMESCKNETNKHTLFHEFYCNETNANPEELSDERKKQIAKILSDITGGGFDTSAATLAWAFLYFDRQPLIMEKCRQEIDKVVSGRHVTIEQKPQLPYFCATVYDILRLSTVAPLGLVRKVTTDTSLCGFTIEKDTMVMANLWNANHDDAIWKNPDLLDPTHFLTSNGELDKKLARDINTFSFGVRRCPGDQIAFSMLFAVLGTIIKSFDFNLKQRPEDLLPMRGMTLKPKYYTIQIINR